MKRREFIVLVGGAAAWPLVARAQAARRDKPFRIVTLPDFSQIRRRWFSDAMRGLGWAEGRDFIVVEPGFQYGKHDEGVKSVVADKPDLIIVQSTAAAVALRRATATIPIVMITSGYPVEAGVADSLAKPGKNVTGNTAYAGTEIWGKLLQLLRDAKPGVKRVSVLWTYVPPTFPREEIEPCYTELRNAERLLGLKLHIVEVANADQVPAALAEIDAERPDALLLTYGIAVKVRSSVMQFAVNKSLPTITDGRWPATVEPQPLLVYGAEGRELVRSAAASIDKILKGAKPGDLPIQQPTKFELIVNLKAAKALGLVIPPSILTSADEVIE